MSNPNRDFFFRLCPCARREAQTEGGVKDAHPATGDSRLAERAETQTGSAILCRCCGVFIHQREDVVARGGRQRKDQSLEAELHETLDVIVFGGCPKQRQRELFAAELFLSFTQLLHPAG